MEEAVIFDTGELEDTKRMEMNWQQVFNHYQSLDLYCAIPRLCSWRICFVVIPETTRPLECFTSSDVNDTGCGTRNWN